MKKIASTVVLLLLCICYSHGQTLSVTLSATNYNGYQISCFGEKNGSLTATITGGTAPYAIEWSTGETTATIIELAAGYYIVRVSDSFGAEALAEITLTEPEPLQIGELIPFVYPNGYNVSAFGACNGSIATTINGGTPPYTYEWVPGQQTILLPTNLCANENLLKVIDANGCGADKGLGLSEPERDDWQMTGNANTNAATQFMGTTDNKDLNFKTNNTSRFKLKANGDINVPGFAGTVDRLLYTDASGNLKSFPFKMATSTNLCTSAPYKIVWQESPANIADIFSCWRNLGIGTDSPQDRLEVKGGLRVTAWDLNMTNMSDYLKIQHDGGNARIDNFGVGDLLINFGDNFNTGNKNVKICTGTSGNVETGGNTYLATGTGKNVGIGKLNPNYKLDVDGEVNATGLRIDDIPINLTSLSNQWLQGTGPDDIYHDIGNVGIGESNPVRKLVVNGNGFELKDQGTSFLFRAHNSGPEIASSTGTTTFWTSSPIGYNTIVTANHKIYDNSCPVTGGNCDPSHTTANMFTDLEFADSYFRIKTPESAVVFIDDDGNNANAYFTIARNASYFSGEKLLFRLNSQAMEYFDEFNNVQFKVTNAGRAYARSMKVTLTTFSDFVFNHDYELMPLNELSNFIKANNHLPGIPTEKQVVKDGLDLGEFSAKLLEKVEELTLHVIQLNEKTEQMATENAELNKELQKLKKQLK